MEEISVHALLFMDKFININDLHMRYNECSECLLEVEVYKAKLTLKRAAPPDLP